MVNDVTNVDGCLQEAVDRLENNLAAMGVTASYDSTKGYFALLDEILNIEPAVAGLNLPTSLTCTVNKFGNTLVISGEANVYFDDTSSDDIDFDGNLKNATIKIYDGNTLLGTCITDNNGHYSFNYNPTGVTLQIYAMFEGTDNYQPSYSTSVQVIVASLTLSSDINVVEVGDVVNLTATYLDADGDPIPNETIEFYDGNTLIGSDVTDSNGEATVSFSVQDTEPLNIQASWQSIIFSEIIMIKYCVTNNWSTGWITSSYASVSITDNQIRFSNSSSYYGAYIFNDKIGVPYSVELEYVDTGGGNFVFGLGFVNDNYSGTNTNYIANTYYGKTNNDYWGCLANGKSARPVTGDVYRFDVYEDHIDTYKNDVFLHTCTPSVSPFTGRFAIIGTDYPRTQQWRNIKIIKL